MNIARAMESGGRALAAYLKPRESGEVKDKSTEEIGRGGQDADLRRRILAVRQRALLRPADQDGQGLSRSLGLGDAPHGRRRGDAGDLALAARQALCRSRMEVEPVLRFHDAGLSADHAMGAGPRAQRRGRRPAHAQEGRVLRQPDHQRAVAVELRADQSGSAAPDRGAERRQSRPRHDRCWRRTSRPARGTLRIRQSDPANLVVGVNMATTPGKVDLPERADAADPVRSRRPRTCCARRS